MTTDNYKIIMYYADWCPHSLKMLEIYNILHKSFPWLRKTTKLGHGKSVPMFEIRIDDKVVETWSGASIESAKHLIRACLYNAYNKWPDK